MKSADKMPESKYSYRPTKDVRSFAEILNHVADSLPRGSHFSEVGTVRLTNEITGELLIATDLPGQCRQRILDRWTAPSKDVLPPYPMELRQDRICIA